MEASWSLSITGGSGAEIEMDASAVTIAEQLNVNHLAGFPQLFMEKIKKNMLITEKENKEGNKEASIVE